MNQAARRTNVVTMILYAALLLTLAGAFAGLVPVTARVPSIPEP